MDTLYAQIDNGSNSGAVVLEKNPFYLYTYI